LLFPTNGCCFQQTAVVADGGGFRESSTPPLYFSFSARVNLIEMEQLRSR
jgi:hypothetical protein